MVELMEKYPGVLVLHDFYIGHLLKYMHFNSDIDLTSDVDTSHGLKGLLSFEVGGYDAIWNWPINWRLFKYSSEVIAHSEYHYQLLRHFYDKSWHPKINVIPQLRKVEPIIEVERKKEIRASLGIEEDCFLFCSFGQLGRNKANLLTVKAFMQAREFIDQKSKLIFVGSNDDPELISAISELIKGTEFEDKIDFTGHVEQIDYENYLRIADVAIQLRINSRGETSRAVLDCMANGNPVILNEHGTNEDFQKGVLKIADPINQQDLIQAMVDVAKGKVDIHDIGDLARDYVSQKHNPETIGNKYREVVERTIQKDNRKVFGPAIQNIVRQADFAKVKNNLALCAAKNLSIRKQTRILVDVSEINRSDLQSGIQRVVKQILTEWLQNPAPTPFIEPVYIDGSHLYRASRFSAKISGLSDKGLITEREIFIQPGDILLFLDAAWGVFEKYGDVISEVRNCGGKVVSVLYDMIPIEFPQFTNRSTVEAYHKWFNFSLHESDALVCISKTVAESVERYLATNQISLGRQLDILHFHLGADIPGNTLDKTTNDAVVEINRLSERPEYLMVGTIEPRKGHDFVLDCFEEKW
jgi:glycosyltransferase involved in cell wall biosynthesis